MSVWERYSSRSEVRGKTRREAALKQERRWIDRYADYSLSYHKVVMDGEDIGAIILDSDNLNIKTICVHSGQPFNNGATILWNDQYWLVTALDANDEVYIRATMQQCNYLLRWINAKGEIIERWSIVEDGTKLERISTYAMVWHTGNGVQKRLP